MLQEDAGQASGLLWLSPLSMFQSGSGVRTAAYAEQLGGFTHIIDSGAHGPGFYQEPSDLGAREEGASMFHQAELFIQDNLGEPLSLERVAGHLHVTTRHLTRLFRKYGHQSFVHYVQERRVRQAKHLLLNTDRQIKEIAVSCGFESVHYFTRVFTSKLGVTPARFRRSQFSEGRYDSEL